MRVLLVTGSFPPMTCGVGDYTACLADALAQQPGVEVAVLTGVEAASSGRHTSVEVFPVIRAWAPDELGTVRKVVRSWKPDVIHIQFPTQGYQGGTLPWMLPVAWLGRWTPIVQTWHEYFPEFTPGFTWHGVRWAAYALALSRGDVVVVRPEYRRRMGRRWRLLTSHKRFELVPSAPAVPRVVLTAQERQEIRSRYEAGSRALLVFFGFFFEHKGIDDLLQIMDPQRHRLVLVGDVRTGDPYQAALVERVAREPFARAVTWTGFLPPVDAARILAAADAVVLPLRAGAGSWNTSVQAAILQGTFLLTTSRERHGYDPEQNVYHARPGDLADLRRGLEDHLGHRIEQSDHAGKLSTWADVARRHIEIYGRKVRQGHRLPGKR